MYYLKTYDAPEDGIAVTLDGLILLTDVLGKAGYGELLSDLFERFRISGIRDLAPGQYVPFAVAIKKMAMGDYLI